MIGSNSQGNGRGSGGGHRPQKPRILSRRAEILQMYLDGVQQREMRERLGLDDICASTFSRHLKVIVAAASHASHVPPLSPPSPATVPAPVSQPKPEAEPAQQEDRKRSTAATAAKQSAGDDEPYDVLLRMKESGTKAGW